MILDMDKVRIVGPKSAIRVVINRLHKLKVLHIVEKNTPGIEAGKPIVGIDEISTSLVKLRSIASQWSIPLKNSSPDSLPLPSLLNEVNRIAESAKLHLEQIKESERIIKKHEDLLQKVKFLLELGLSSQDLKKYDSIDYFVGYLKDSKGLVEEIRKKTSKFLIEHAEIGKNEGIALFIEKTKSEEVRPILSAHNFSTMDVSELLPQKNIEESISREKTKKKRSEKDLIQLRKEYANRISSIERRLSEELDKLKVPLRFQETDQTFVIWGFIPKYKTPYIIESLEKITNRKIIIEIHEIDSHEEVPVILKNPDTVKNFQFFIDLYSLPKYKEIDPSWFLFITFPLLYGFMLGDIGYGITTLLLFWLLKKKMPQFSNFFSILIISSLATIFFGAIFGEFFGFEMYNPIISRNPEHNLMILLTTAIAIGVIHVNAGLIAGFFNELKSHGLKAAIFGKLGWIFFEIGVAILALTYTKILSIPLMTGYLIIIFSVFMLYKGEGIKALVELPSIFGNILSYARLMAIGLSSAGLAMVINNLSGEMFRAGGISILFGIIVLALGHVVNIGIGCLGSFLHSLRLHYVELFSKFYHGGGKKFKPFGYEGGI